MFNFWDGLPGEEPLMTEAEEKERQRVANDIKLFASVMRSVASNIDSAVKNNPDELSWKMLGQILAETAACVAVQCHVYTELYPELTRADIQNAANHLCQGEIANILVQTAKAKGFPVGGPATKQ